MVVDKGLSNYLPKKAQRILVTLFPLDAAVTLRHIWKFYQGCECKGIKF